MYIGITTTQKPIFQEKITLLTTPEYYPTESMTYVIYQFQSKTLFSESVYKKVESAYFADDLDREIPRKAWTEEMKAHAAMRESTEPREPKSVRYTFIGKALFTVLFVLILVLGFLAVQSFNEMKKINAQNKLMNTSPK
ncbi:hypothetical protein TH53_04460 [Pedobacter lusitanus]|uniref:Uncharacterized protein n=1 Tax=Pedobacter lusitanus TaxID=1503925 RepID=A0A0D0G0G0_9SPHI|nr:hypothetical protein [Pedobacter lusitanus]KIO78274.1 hypothetical protein TH53_04460 [Pedobacter lusitanus]